MSADSKAHQQPQHEAPAEQLRGHQQHKKGCQIDEHHKDGSGQHGNAQKQSIFQGSNHGVFIPGCEAEGIAPHPQPDQARQIQQIPEDGIALPQLPQEAAVQQQEQPQGPQEQPQEQPLPEIAPELPEKAAQASPLLPEKEAGIQGRYGHAYGKHRQAPDQKAEIQSHQLRQPGQRPEKQPFRLKQRFHIFFPLFLKMYHIFPQKARGFLEDCRIFSRCLARSHTGAARRHPECRGFAGCPQRRETARQRVRRTEIR